MNFHVFEFRSSLLEWFSGHRRNLPWRAEKDAYKIWLSEVILQQTRVVQGTPYYLRFVEAYPRVIDLAEAPEEAVLKLWQGLGYYSRARNLHTAAKTIAASHGGRFPQSYEDIRALKGVGDYTAAAIASIAYGLPHAVLDGNVYRVLARLFCIATPINSHAAKAEFGKLAQELLDPGNPGDYNEGLMELGATVCTPKSPLCSRCPVQKHCQAFAEGRQEEFPIKEAAKAPRERFFHYLLVRTPDGIYVRRRGPGDVWQGLYDLPLCETASPGRPAPEELQQAAGVAVKDLIPLQSSTHILSHQRLRLFFYEAMTDGEPNGDGIVFADMRQLKQLPVPKPLEIFFREQLNAPKLL